MPAPPLATRLATRAWPALFSVGALAAVIAGANLLHLVSDEVTNIATLAVAASAGALFLCLVFDRRVQNAISAVNLEMRTRRKAGRPWRFLVFEELPSGTRLPSAALGLALSATFLFCLFETRPTSPPLFLSFAGVALVVTTLMALVAGRFPTDGFKDVFGAGPTAD